MLRVSYDLARPLPGHARAVPARTEPFDERALDHEPAALDYIESDDTYFQKEPMERLAADGQLMAYRHESFWQCMDTLRDKVHLETLWDMGSAPWKVWS